MNSHLTLYFKPKLHLRVPLLDQELLTLQELILVISVVRIQYGIAQALVFVVVFCGALLYFSSDIFWSLYRLFYGL